jgi:hypothetical protein
VLLLVAEEEEVILEEEEEEYIQPRMELVQEEAVGHLVYLLLLTMVQLILVKVTLLSH